MASREIYLTREALMAMLEVLDHANGDYLVFELDKFQEQVDKLIKPTKSVDRDSMN